MKILLTVLVVLTVVLTIFLGCSKDENPVTNPINPTNPTFVGLNGNWRLDKIQMVSAPSTGGPSSAMKSALVPLGMISASNAGWLNATIGGIKWNSLSIGGSDNFSKIQFINSQTGWIGSYSSLMLIRTFNGGNSWTSLSLPGSNTWNSLFHFINGVTGYATSYSGSSNSELYKTTNGGQNWFFKSYIPNSASSIYFINENTGFYSGYYSLYKTSNGGNNWVSIPMGLMYYTNRIKFIDNLTGWIFGSNSSYNQLIIKKTIDGGNNWTDIAPFGGQGLGYVNNVSCVNSLNLFMLANNNYGYSLFKSVDGGNSWTSIEIPFSNPNDLFFVDIDEGYLAGDNGIIARTKNGGAGWSIESSGTDINIYSICFPDRATGFAAGSNNTVLKQSNLTDTSFVFITGKITNTAIQLITNSGDKTYTAAGTYQLSGNNINCIVNSYSGSFGNFRVGSGIISLTDKLIIDFNFAYGEKWHVELIR